MIIILIFLVISVLGTVLGLFLREYSDIFPCMVIAGIPTSILFGLVFFTCFFGVKFDIEEQLKHREQILYQVQNITPETDKVALNSTILEYNEWVVKSKFNKSKGVWCFECFFSLDGHEIIPLV